MPKNKKNTNKGDIAMPTHRKKIDKGNIATNCLVNETFEKKKCHHVNNKVGQSTPIDRESTNKGNVVTKVANIPFFGDIFGI
jgi:translation initiation factor 1 (eIF-1/SUI1)